MKVLPPLSPSAVAPVVPSVPVTLDQVACARARARAYHGTLAASDKRAAPRTDQTADDGPAPSAVMMSSARLREARVNESHEQQRRAQDGGEHSST